MLHITLHSQSLTLGKGIKSEEIPYDSIIVSIHEEFLIKSQAGSFHTIFYEGCPVIYGDVVNELLDLISASLVLFFHYGKDE